MWQEKKSKGGLGKKNNDMGKKKDEKEKLSSMEKKA
jgi:hypothetical protein